MLYNLLVAYCCNSVVEVVTNLIKLLITSCSTNPPAIFKTLQTVSISQRLFGLYLFAHSHNLLEIFAFYSFVVVSKLTKSSRANTLIFCLFIKMKAKSIALLRIDISVSFIQSIIVDE